MSHLLFDEPLLLRLFPRIFICGHLQRAIGQRLDGNGRLIGKTADGGRRAFRHEERSGKEVPAGFDAVFFGSREIRFGLRVRRGFDPGGSSQGVAFLALDDFAAAGGNVELLRFNEHELLGAALFNLELSGSGVGGRRKWKKEKAN